MQCYWWSLISSLDANREMVPSTCRAVLYTERGIDLLELMNLRLNPLLREKKKRDVLMSLIILAQAGQSLRSVQKCVWNDNELQQNNGSHLVHFWTFYIYGALYRAYSMHKWIGDSAFIKKKSLLLLFCVGVCDITATTWWGLLQCQKWLNRLFLFVLHATWKSVCHNPFRLFMHLCQWWQKYELNMSPVYKEMTWVLIICTNNQTIIWNIQHNSDWTIDLHLLFIFYTVV